MNPVHTAFIQGLGDKYIKILKQKAFACLNSKPHQLMLVVRRSESFCFNILNIIYLIIILLWAMLSVLLLLLLIFVFSFNTVKSSFQIWDTAGQERFKSLRTPFYRGSDMCILTYAVDDPPSFKNLDTWRKEFVYYADVKADFPFLVVGNKVKVFLFYVVY